jgi:hypothetical protein
MQPSGWGLANIKGPTAKPKQRMYLRLQEGELMNKARGANNRGDGEAALRFRDELKKCRKALHQNVEDPHTVMAPCKAMIYPLYVYIYIYIYIHIYIYIYILSSSCI